MVELKDELLTVAEAAKLLKVTPHTIYRWIAEGRLPAVRYSRRILRVRRGDLEQSPGGGGTAIAEARSTYEAGSHMSDEATRRETRQLLDRYRRLSKRRRRPGEPRPGSRDALMNVVGSITHEEAEELRRIIREAKTYSPPVEL